MKELVCVGMSPEAVLSDQTPKPSLERCHERDLEYAADIMSARFAVVEHSRSGSGLIPTRPKSNLSASQQTRTVRSASV